jgi:hypothetical protein
MGSLFRKNKQGYSCCNKHQNDAQFYLQGDIEAYESQFGAESRKQPTLHARLKIIRADYATIWRTYMRLLINDGTDRSSAIQYWAVRRLQFEWTFVRIQFHQWLSSWFGVQDEYASKLAMNLLNAQLELVTATLHG